MRRVIRKNIDVAISPEDVQDALDSKQDTLTAQDSTSAPTDTDKVSCIDNTTNKRWTFAKVWYWIVSKCVTALNSSSTNSQVPTAKAVLLLVAPQTDRGDLAVKYATSATAGLSNIGEYDSSIERRCVKFGKMVQLTFQLKGSVSSAASANWTIIGTVQSPYRPARETPITVQVYNGTSNEAAGGTVRTDGTIRIWCNSKPVTNNYQMRCNAVYEGTW